MNGISEDFFRVTSCQHVSARYVIFSGVPLKRNSYRINSGKYIISVKCETDYLPVRPATGQQWWVKGPRLLDNINAGDYALEQHTYESPIEMQCTLPNTGESFIRFVAAEADFTGIGEAKARALWDAFGAELHGMLQQDSPAHRDRLLELLSKQSVDSLYRGYRKYRNLAHANWMSSMRIPLRIQQRILKYHDEHTLQVIKANPYSLMGFGMSFADVDNLHDGLSVPKSDPVRLSAAVEYAIRKQVEAGHTYTTHQAIKPVVTKLLGDGDLSSQALMNGYTSAQFMLNPETSTYHPTAHLLMERVVAKRLQHLARLTVETQGIDHTLEQALNALPYRLTAQQISAVETALKSGVSCITGGAGTGKTTVLRTVLRSFASLGYEIHAVALSGRAAMRLHESIGFITMTIARLLREEPIAPSQEQGNKHLLVIDEASMVDLPTMYRIVTHLDPSVRIIFSGDPNQLPPIGCGKVLADIVELGTIPNTTLDIVKRQEGSTGIPEYSACINRGEVPPALTVGGITFHETGSDQIVPLCQSLYAQSPANTQIVAPTKTLVADLNQQCQRSVNPHGEQLQFTLHGDDFYLDLRKGDPILFTKNNYNIGIQNGSLGILTSVEPDPETKEKNYGVVTLDTGELIAITEDVLDCMQLGYAITLHKAQGSQFPRIVVALRKGRITDRAWLYTAVTRAEAEVHIVGSALDFARITRAVSMAHRRNSYLTKIVSS